MIRLARGTLMLVALLLVYWMNPAVAWAALSTMCVVVLIKRRRSYIGLPGTSHSASEGR